MGACIVEFGTLNLNVHLSVWKIFWEFRLDELLIYLIPTHLVPLSEYTGGVSINGGWGRGHAVF